MADQLLTLWVWGHMDEEEWYKQASPLEEPAWSMCWAHTPCAWLMDQLEQVA